MAFCNTWLDSTRLDDDIILDGFTVYRSDRTKESGKTRGGGLCIYINNQWCSNVKIHYTLCLPNLELFTLSVRPFYLPLPREFSNIVLCCVYVPPSADALAADDTIASYMQSMLLCYPHAPVFVNFNRQMHVGLLPSLLQYVHVSTRNNNTIGLCYGNIFSAYSARAHPPLGRVDRPQCHQPHPSVLTTVEDSLTDQGRGSTMLSMDSGCHHAAPGISGLHRLGCVCTRFGELK